MTDRAWLHADLRTAFGVDRRPIQFLARISFGLYLLNQVVGYLIAYRLMELGADRLLQVAGAMIGVIGLAWLLTRYVEEPAYRALSAVRIRSLGARAFAWLTT